MRRLIPVAAIAALISTGCSVNPVTGENQLILVSEGQEVQMGIQAYDPTKQSQGGEYDVDPALTEYVQNVGNRLAAVSDRELPYEFAVLNNSTPNAWALPGGKIAINRGLLTELDSEAELAAVLGHEIVHAAARHSAQAMSRGLLSQVLVVATAIATSDSDYGNLAVGGANVGAAVLNATYGRGAELESDLYGMRYMSEAGYDPQGAVTLQETFVRLSENRRTDWLSGLFASHPPSQARVEANRDTAAKLRDGGKIGKDDYAKAMRRTMQLKPAYDAYDEGRKALAEGNVDQAVALSEKALDLFNGEAHFHALRGDIRLMQKNYDWAITNYTRAIERRDDFFYYHLQRGLAKKEQKNLDGARADLDRSVELMPTAPGYYALGQIAEQRGDIDTAIQHYSVVAQGGGDYGKAAAGDLARLDMPRNPGNYIARRCSADASGNLVVSVQNQANVTVAGVRIAIQYTDNAGRLQQQVQSIAGQIPPGRVASLNTGLGPYTGGSCPTEVVGAQVVQ
ncbi:MAG: M48 family metalloprotease [Woeseia sp.]|nr:M48 family metalloprotease [Woeseia sp.]